MDSVDNRTILMVILFAVQIITAIGVKKYAGNDDEEDEEDKEDNEEASTVDR